MSSARTRAQQDFADRCQGLVAGGVSEVVVVALEVVEIEHHDGEGTMFAAGGVEFALEEFLHVAAVVKAGERIADGLQAKSFTEAEVGNGDRDVFGDGGGEVAAARKGVRVDLRIGYRVRGIVVLDGQRFRWPRRWR